MICRQWVAGGAVCLGLMLIFTNAAFADSAPKVDTSTPTPVVYPRGAQSSGEQGTVVLSVYVSSRGKPILANVARTSGFPDLDNAAVETVMNWHYVPAVHGGGTASDWATVQVVYKLTENSDK